MPESRTKPEVFIFEGEAKAILAAAESFTKMGFRVVAGSSRRYCLGFYSRFIRERIIYPDEVRQPDRCIEFLLDLARRRRFEMILPLGDVVTQLVCSRRDEFMRYSKLVLVPYDTFMICRDKVETMKAAARFGVPIPKTYDPDDQSIDEICRLVDYPVLVKPACSNGARGIVYAHDAHELRARYQEVSQGFGRTFVQELIPHAGGQYKTELLLDRDGTILASVGYAKLRFYPASGGSSTLNLTQLCPDMMEHAIRLARGINWFGMCDFDWIYDVRDRQPKLMEINPRVTDTIQIANYAGVDFFKALYDMACGRRAEPQMQYRTGLYMRFLFGDLLWFLTTGESRLRARPSFFRFFGSDTRYLVTSLADPGPALGWILDALSSMLDPARRSFLLRLGKPKKKADA